MASLLWVQGGGEGLVETSGSAGHGECLLWDRTGSVSPAVFTGKRYRRSLCSEVLGSFVAGCVPSPGKLPQWPPGRSMGWGGGPLRQVW